jgi:hypothetical protein
MALKIHYFLLFRTTISRIYVLRTHCNRSSFFCQIGWRANPTMFIRFKIHTFSLAFFKSMQQFAQYTKKSTKIFFATKKACLCWASAKNTPKKIANFLKNFSSALKHGLFF